jgi:alkanesulfonate monooxygenase SsuD/methylene tetrahydromethanopterin reductase-like flavin-dependent oxidoreductase (luciferase family)
MVRAGRLGDGYVSTMTSTERYRSNLDAIASAAAAAGRTLARFGTGAFLFTVLGRRDEAVARAAALLGTIYRRDFRDAAPRYALCGDVPDVLEQMRAFRDAGVRHFLLVPLMDPLELTERAGAEILPALRAGL